MATRHQPLSTLFGQLRVADADAENAPPPPPAARAKAAPVRTPQYKPPTLAATRGQPAPSDAAVDRLCAMLNDARVDIRTRGAVRTREVRVRTVRTTLTDTQTHVLRLAVEQGENVFYTGGAGTGKSMLLKQIISSLREKYPEPGKVAVTAPTGIAAVNINGCTIHSFAGVGLLNGTVSQIVESIKRSQRTLARWRNTQVLVIDEVSMVDGELFDKLEQVARIVRGNHGVAFGGIQLVITGDFFQLPPVSREKHVKFAFEASSWAHCFKPTNKIQLTQIFRQQDPRLVTMLNQLRQGTCSVVK